MEDDFRLVCPYCGGPIDLNNCFGLVNAGLDDEHIECFDCHIKNITNGDVCMCLNCYEYITPDNFEINPKTGAKDICPTCQKRWNRKE